MLALLLGRGCIIRETGSSFTRISLRMRNFLLKKFVSAALGCVYFVTLRGCKREVLMHVILGKDYVLYFR